MDSKILKLIRAKAHHRATICSHFTGIPVATVECHISRLRKARRIFVERWELTKIEGQLRSYMRAYYRAGSADDALKPGVISQSDRPNRVRVSSIFHLAALTGSTQKAAK